MNLAGAGVRADVAKRGALTARLRPRPPAARGFQAPPNLQRIISGMIGGQGGPSASFTPPPPPRALPQTVHEAPAAQAFVTQQPQQPLHLDPAVQAFLTQMLARQHPVPFVGSP